MTEMEKLSHLLEESGIPYELGMHNRTHTPQIFYPNEAECEVDAICHEFSYGYEQGLLEVMAPTEFADDHEWGGTVCGNLTADEAFAIFKEYHEKYTGDALRKTPEQLPDEGEDEDERREAIKQGMELGEFAAHAFGITNGPECVCAFANTLNYIAETKSEEKACDMILAAIVSFNDAMDEMKKENK